MVVAVFVFDILKPAYGDYGHAPEVLVYLVYLRLDTCYQLLVLVFREFGDALHLDFQKSEDIVLCHLTYQLRIERREPLVDIFAELVGRVGVFERFPLVYALLDEYLFERGEE